MVTSYVTPWSGSMRPILNAAPGFLDVFFAKALMIEMPRLSALPFWPTRSLSKAPTGHLRVLGKRGLLLPSFRAAALGLYSVSKHPENAFHVSVSSFYVLSKKNR